MYDIFGEGKFDFRLWKAGDTGIRPDEIEHLGQFSRAVSLWTNDWKLSTTGVTRKNDAEITALPQRTWSFWWIIRCGQKMRRSNPGKALRTTKNRDKGNDSLIKIIKLFRCSRRQATSEHIGHQTGVKKGNLEARTVKTNVDDPSPMIKYHKLVISNLRWASNGSRGQPLTQESDFLPNVLFDILLDLSSFFLRLQFSYVVLDAVKLIEDELSATLSVAPLTLEILIVVCFIVIPAGKVAEMWDVSRVRILKVKISTIPVQSTLSSSTLSFTRIAHVHCPHLRKQIMQFLRSRTNIWIFMIVLFILLRSYGG